MELSPRLFGMYRICLYLLFPPVETVGPIWSKKSFYFIEKCFASTHSQIRRRNRTRKPVRLFDEYVPSVVWYWKCVSLRKDVLQRRESVFLNSFDFCSTGEIPTRSIFLGNIHFSSWLSIAACDLVEEKEISLISDRYLSKSSWRFLSSVGMDKRFLLDFSSILARVRNYIWRLGVFNEAFHFDLWVPMISDVSGTLTLLGKNIVQ